MNWTLTKNGMAPAVRALRCGLSPLIVNRKLAYGLTISVIARNLTVSPVSKRSATKVFYANISSVYQINEKLVFGVLILPYHLIYLKIPGCTFPSAKS